MVQAVFYAVDRIDGSLRAVLRVLQFGKYHRDVRVNFTNVLFQELQLFCQFLDGDLCV